MELNIDAPRPIHRYPVVYEEIQPLNRTSQKTYNTIEFDVDEPRPLHRYDVRYSVAQRPEQTTEKKHKKIIRVIVDFFKPPERDSMPIDSFPKLRTLINIIKK